MMRIANDFAAHFGGHVVDDNRAAFGTEAADLIRAQIRQFQGRMAENGIPAAARWQGGCFAW